MESAAAPAVSIRQLEKRYSGGWWGPSVVALRGVSFDVPRGAVFGLLGPNGAGKTTIIKILLGIVRSTGGQARLLDEPAGHRRSRLRVGYLPENLQVSAHHTAESALRYFAQLSRLSGQEARQRIPELLDRVGLGRRSRESVRQFSKGMRQRLGLAQALLHDPELLILDEPTDGLDPVGRSEVREILQQIRDSGRTVFLNSHLLLEVEQICDRLAILSDGLLRFEGDIEQLNSVVGGDVEIEVLANEASIRAALQAESIRLIKPMSNDRTRVTIQAEATSDVDRIVDATRRRHISILGLQRRRRSLEDFFMDVVRQPSTITPDTSSRQGEPAGHGGEANAS